MYKTRGVGHNHTFGMEKGIINFEGVKPFLIKMMFLKDFTFANDNLQG